MDIQLFWLSVLPPFPYLQYFFLYVMASFTFFMFIIFLERLHLFIHNKNFQKLIYDDFNQDFVSSIPINLSVVTTQSTYSRENVFYQHYAYKNDERYQLDEIIVIYYHKYL
jgi:hypothetical protein